MPVRTAFLLTGERHSAEDPAQSTLERARTAWHRVDAADDPDAYARREEADRGDRITQAAQAMGCSVGTVKSNSARSRAIRPRGWRSRASSRRRPTRSRRESGQDTHGRERTRHGQGQDHPPPRGRGAGDRDRDGPCRGGRTGRTAAPGPCRGRPAEEGPSDLVGRTSYFVIRQFGSPGQNGTHLIVPADLPHPEGTEINALPQPLSAHMRPPVTDPRHHGQN